MGASAAGVAAAPGPMWGAGAAAAPDAAAGEPVMLEGACVVGRPGSPAAEAPFLRPNQPRRAGAAAVAVGGLAGSA